MSLPPLFLLYNELLIEIISYLCPADIYACLCTCHQLNDLIVNSHLIQYIICTALSGVYDPLNSDLSLPDRLDAFRRWEIAWREMDLREPNGSIDAPVPLRSRNRPPAQFCFGRYFVVIREGYGISAGYSFLDMHARTSDHTNVECWTTIEIDSQTVLVFAFASELNLSVAISAPSTIERRKTILTISPMCFSTGEPHPLASKSALEMTVTGMAAHNLSDTVVIGDYILYWVGSPGYTRFHESTICSIYLVAWKEGWVSELRTARPGVYGSVLSVLSDEMILLIRLREPALELCRLKHIGDRERATLETVRILSLPELTQSASLGRAMCIGEHPGHALFSKIRQQHPPPLMTSTSGSSGKDLVRLAEAKGSSAPRRRLRSVPEDGIISVVMQVSGLSGYSRTIDLSVRCRTLLGFAHDVPEPKPEKAGGSAPEEELKLPWENWGPANTRILDHDSVTWGSLVGERRATVGQLLPTRITIRDYNPSRVRHALALVGGEAEREMTLECGSVVKVVKETSVYRGGEWFLDDIESSLPYVETVTPYLRCEDVFMDEDNLLAEVRTEAGERKFYLHSM